MKAQSIKVSPEIQEKETSGIIIPRSIQILEMKGTMKGPLISKGAPQIGEIGMIEIEEGIEKEVEVRDKVTAKVDGMTHRETREIWHRKGLEISLNRALLDQQDPLDAQIHPLPHRLMP